MFIKAGSIGRACGSGKGADGALAIPLWMVFPGAPAKIPLTTGLNSEDFFRAELIGPLLAVCGVACLEFFATRPARCFCSASAD
jgi:hypothetical protein